MKRECKRHPDQELTRHGNCMACCRAEGAREWNAANPERHKQLKREHHARAMEDPIRAEAIRARNREQYQKRMHNPLERLKNSLRARVRAAMKRVGGTSKYTHEILGMPIAHFRCHLELQFTEGMTWDNYGEWHIDHIVPLASARTPEETLELCHFSNLQPLWARDNLTKHAKVD